MDPIKESELAYFDNIGRDGVDHSLGKPFVDANAGRLLMEMGAVLSLLPSPPARVVDLGCGVGWTSDFLARSGYDVVGTDLSPTAVDAANAHFGGPRLTFRVYDHELPWQDGDERFDAALFFDSLHHAADEAAVLRNVFALLQPGGVLVACEPGTGHAESPGSRAAVEAWGVRERDMPPKLIIDAALEAGFTSVQTYPHPHELHRQSYAVRSRASLRERVLDTPAGRAVRLARTSLHAPRTWGIVVMAK